MKESLVRARAPGDPCKKTKKRRSRKEEMEEVGRGQCGGFDGRLVAQ